MYKALLDILPHRQFTFAKAWLLFAQFEIRQKDLVAARKIMGTAIGMCPKAKLFKGYIELELQLREFDRCRKLYEKFLEFQPSNCSIWIKYSELENLLGDDDRARAILELAVNQPVLDMPELLWKAYIDFEVAMKDEEKARQLYERLLERTQHVKVWISYAQFEAAQGNIEQARCIYDRGDKCLKDTEDKEARVMLLESWKDFEDKNGDEERKERFEQRMPKRIKKRRKVQTEDGTDAGWEEYFDYIFPDDSMAAPNLKLLQMARLWKQQQEKTT